MYEEITNKHTIIAKFCDSSLSRKIYNTLLLYMKDKNTNKLYLFIRAGRAYLRILRRYIGARVRLGDKKNC